MNLKDIIGEHLITLGFKATDRPGPKELKDAWKTLCKKNHPDIGGNSEEFLKFSHAYQMISDPKYRNDELKKEQMKKDPNFRGDLNIAMNCKISFEDAFFGRDMVVSYNPSEVDEKFNPLKGQVFDIKIVHVPVEAGLVESMTQSEVGGGNFSGDVFGDLTLTISVIPHSKYRIDKKDIRSTEQIPLHIMLKGGTVEVATMYGIRSLKIPAGTTPGSELKIPKCGVMKQGHHFVGISPLFPNKKELESEDWAGLPIDWDVGNEEDEEAKNIMDILENLKAQGIIIE